MSSTDSLRKKMEKIESKRMNLSSSDEDGVSGDEIKKDEGEQNSVLPLNTPMSKSRQGPKSFLDSPQCSSPSASGFIVSQIPKPDAKRKASSSRKFSGEDEIALLNGLHVFWANGRNSKWAEFHILVKNNLSQDFSKVQVYEKIRKLKKKFEVNLERALANGGSFNHSDPHETIVFDLSMMLWGNDDKVAEEPKRLAESKLDETLKASVGRDENSAAPKERKKIGSKDHEGKTLELDEAVEEDKEPVERDENSDVIKKRNKIGSKNLNGKKILEVAESVGELKAPVGRDENSDLLKKRKKPDSKNHDGKGTLEVSETVEDLKAPAGRRDGKSIVLKKKKKTVNNTHDGKRTRELEESKRKKNESKNPDGKKTLEIDEAVEELMAYVGRDENASVVKKKKAGSKNHEGKRTHELDEAVQEVKASVERDENSDVLKEKKKTESNNHDAKKTLEVEEPVEHLKVSVERDENPDVLKKTKKTEDKNHNAKKTPEVEEPVEHLKTSVGRDESYALPKEVKKSESKNHAEKMTLENEPVEQLKAASVGRYGKTESKSREAEKSSVELKASSTSGVLKKRKKTEVKNIHKEKNTPEVVDAAEKKVVSVEGNNKIAEEKTRNSGITRCDEEKKRPVKSLDVEERNKGKKEKKRDKKKKLTVENEGNAIIQPGNDEENKMATAEGGRKEEFECDFPLLCASLNGYPYMKKNCFLIGREKGLELEEKWKELRVMELSLYSKTIEVVNRHLVSNGRTK